MGAVKFHQYLNGMSSEKAIFFLEGLETQDSSFIGTMGQILT